MKKTLMALFMSAVIFSSCNGGETLDIDAQKAAETIADGIGVTNDQLMEAPAEVINEWYTFDDMVVDFTVYVSATGGTANEIAVVKSKDVKTAEEALIRRVENLKTRFKDYVPAEMVKLDNPVIVTKGDVAVMVIADDTAKAEKLIGEIFK
ncbi:MAG: DUF4358 domain-containing protein [Oscillospiraceae bacterium]|nr:DUF4358 domain-containing protein [Oscillospiraceae bacterium]